ncbi:MAG: glycosyltransferase [Bacteroidota bacterium]
MIEGILWTCLLIVMLYSFWIRGLSKVWDERVISFFMEDQRKDLPSVSLIVPFRNEEKNILQLLQDINQFDYPTDLLECVFVNDHSDDRSVDIINGFSLKYKFLLINAESEGKKSAITTGVKNATHTWIVTTDADTHWDAHALRTLLSHPKINDAEMICGVVDLNASAKNILSNLQVAEYAILQAAGIASLFRHEPLLNSGANLAYRKWSFIELEGYKNHEHIASGDDTFLMLAFANKWNDSVVSNPKSKVSTGTVETWAQYFAQRNRWGKKVKHYADKNIRQVGILFLFSNIGMVLLVFGACTNLYYLLLLVLSCFFKCTAEYSLLKRYYQFYQENFEWSRVLLLTLIYPMVFILTLFSGIVVSNTWKGRKL